MRGKNMNPVEKRWSMLINYCKELDYEGNEKSNSFEETKVNELRLEERNAVIASIYSQRKKSTI